MQEKILCVKRSMLPANWLCDQVAISCQDSEISKVTDTKYCFVDRQHAETDRNYKQIIPYAITVHENKIACYPRHGTESRLHGLWSVGIGGHVNSHDDTGKLMTTIETGLIREISEEFLNLNLKSSRIDFIGIINEELTTVGNMHLGFVYTIDLDIKPCPDSELTGLSWINYNDQHDYKLELWSGLALKLLNRKGKISCRENSTTKPY